MYIIIITWSLWIRNFKQDETSFFSSNLIVKPPPFQVIFIVKTPSILCNFGLVSNVNTVSLQAHRGAIIRANERHAAIGLPSGLIIEPLTSANTIEKKVQNTVGTVLSARLN